MNKVFAIYYEVMCRLYLALADSKQKYRESLKYRDKAMTYAVAAYKARNKATS